MRIASIECLAFAIPGRPYLVGHDSQATPPSAGRYRQHPHYRAIYSPNAESMLVQIVTDTGLTGYGETQACIMPETVTRLIDQLLAPVLVGADPRHPAVLRDRMYDLMRERGHDSGFLPDAIAACDIALWDLAARAAGAPLYQVLGGAYRTHMPCYVSGVPSAGAEEQMDRIGQWIDRGFTRFKLAYAPTIEDHVAHLRRIRDRFGDEVQIMIDAHWAFTVRQTIDLGRALEPFGVRWIECPVPPENAANQALVAQRLMTAHALGEEYRTRYHFLDRLSRHAIDIAQPDVGRTGVTEAVRIAALCLAHDVPIAYHLGAGLGIYTAATLHVAAATAVLDLMEYQPTQLEAADKFYTPSLQPAEGAYALPPGPGLGVTPQLDRLREFAIS